MFSHTTLGRSRSAVSWPFQSGRSQDGKGRWCSWELKLGFRNLAIGLVPMECILLCVAGKRRGRCLES